MDSEHPLRATGLAATAILLVLPSVAAAAAPIASPSPASGSPVARGSEPGPDAAIETDLAVGPEGTVYALVTDPVRVEPPHAVHRQRLLASTDGGRTFHSVDPIPDPATWTAPATGAGDVAVAPDGTVFYATSTADAIHVARSRDRGASWTVEAIPSGAGNAASLWVLPLDRERIRLFWTEARSVPDPEDTRAADPSVTHLWSTSTDGGERGYHPPERTGSIAPDRVGEPVRGPQGESLVPLATDEGIALLVYEEQVGQPTRESVHATSNPVAHPTVVRSPAGVWVAWMEAVDGTWVLQVDRAPGSGAGTVRPHRIEVSAGPGTGLEIGALGPERLLVATRQSPGEAPRTGADVTLLRVDLADGRVQVQAETAHRDGTLIASPSCTTPEPCPPQADPNSLDLAKAPGHPAFLAWTDADRDVRGTPAPGPSAGSSGTGASPSHQASLRSEAPPQQAGTGDHAGVALAAALGGLLLTGLAWAGVGDRLRWFLAALFSRIPDDEVLDNETRAAIRDAVQAEPGIHFRALSRRLDLAHGHLERHLAKLTGAGILVEVEGPSHRCFFLAGQLPPTVQQAVAAAKATGAARILEALTRGPADSVHRLADRAGVAASTTSYHVDRLEEAGVLETERRGRSLAVDLTEVGSRVAALLDP